MKCHLVLFGAILLLPNLLLAREKTNNDSLFAAIAVHQEAGRFYDAALCYYELGDNAVSKGDIQLVLCCIAGIEQALPLITAKSEQMGPAIMLGDLQMGYYKNMYILTGEKVYMSDSLQQAAVAVINVFEKQPEVVREIYAKHVWMNYFLAASCEASAKSPNWELASRWIEAAERCLPPPPHNDSIQLQIRLIASQIAAGKRMAADARQTGWAADSLKKEKKSASHKWPPADLVPDVEVADKFVNEHADQIVNAFARMLQLQNTVIDQENKINVVQSRQKRLLLWYTFLTIGALFVIVCLSSLLLYYRQRRKLHQKEMEQEKLNAYINGLEADRTLVAKELHDNITNRLLIVQHAVAPYADLLPANINDELNGLYTEVRDLSHELQPPMFGYATLPDAIHSHVSKLNAASITRFALHLNNADDFKPLPENYSLNVYRIVQEATNNIVKHAHANRVDISLSIGNNHLYLLIQDDGIGISPETLRTGTGIGLHLMRERTNQLQGVLELVRSEEEQGSVLRFSAPLPKETETAAGG